MGSPTTNLALAVSPSLFTPTAAPDSSYTTCWEGCRQQAAKRGLAPAGHPRRQQPRAAHSDSGGRTQTRRQARAAHGHSTTPIQTWFRLPDLDIWASQHVGAAVHRRQARKRLQGQVGPGAAAHRGWRHSGQAREAGWRCQRERAYGAAALGQSFRLLAVASCWRAGHSCLLACPTCGSSPSP